ncbi:hypothetical protein CTI12_AA294610 [Artemisia annua]|uniref:Uncharacterized protein n=1 Tax=Artemisia annua TaxID=35608 RepID=A0A2U1N851_ARTAN|nr:hypothetical protein CTI12_AA294610 [Artemisia annua]
MTMASKGKKIVIFLDYDGTLSPIVPDPDHAYMCDELCKAKRSVFSGYSFENKPTHGFLHHQRDNHLPSSTTFDTHIHPKFYQSDLHPYLHSQLTGSSIKDLQVSVTLREWRQTGVIAQGLILKWHCYGSFVTWKMRTSKGVSPTSSRQGDVIGSSFMLRFSFIGHEMSLFSKGTMRRLSSGGSRWRKPVWLSSYFIRLSFGFSTPNLRLKSTRVNLFVELHRLGLAPNKVSLTWVLSLFAQSGVSEFGKIMHHYIERCVPVDDETTSMVVDAVSVPEFLNDNSKREGVDSHCASVIYDQKRLTGDAI